MSTEDNKNIVRRYRDLHNSHQLDQLEAVVATDLVSHANLPGLPPGLAGGKIAHQMARKAFSDLHTKTEMLIAEGDKVVEYFTTTGRQTGEFLGIPPTGKSTSVEGMSIFRIVNGKIVEHWGVNDALALLMQLGAMPAPAS